MMNQNSKMETEIILYVSAFVLIWFTLVWIYWGIRTKFTYYREKQIKEDFIIEEYYSFFYGWNILSIEKHPKAFKKMINEFISNPLNKHISEQIKQKGSYVMGSGFPDEVRKEYKEWKRKRNT